MKSKNSTLYKTIPYSKIYFSTQSKIPPLSKPTFNSKLFINLDSLEGTEYDKESNSDTNTDDSENSIEISEKNDDDYYLSKELISELDFSNIPKQKNDSVNIINSLIPLIKDGYEFIPKNLRISKNNKNNNEKKNDWICPICKNLNFSFRVKCNRCGLNKGILDGQNNIMNYNFVW